MKLRDFLAMAAGATALMAVAAATPAAADENKLEELKEQGFARIAIANEPPFTAVGADGKSPVQHRMSPARSSSGSALPTSSPPFPNTAR